MLLKHILSYLPDIEIIGSLDQEITGLAYNSRYVQPGFLFLAIKGYHVDGHRYIPQALECGAVAIVADQRHIDPTMRQYVEQFPHTTLILVPDSKVILAPLAATWHQYPAQRMKVTGITGTKGKTTTTTLISHILDSAGYTTGMITTVDFKIGSRQWSNTLRQSTPEALEIQAMLSDMLQAGCDYAILEASSHGLSPAWNRLGNCAFDIAVFTNVTHEHLDYHGTIEQYRQDKARLFALLEEFASTPLKAHKVAIVNADDPHHAMFLAAAPTTAQRLTYAIHAPADIRADIQCSTQTSTQAHITTPWGACMLNLQLAGTFNLLNALAALSVGLSQGIDLEQAATALSQVPGIRGRMERIEQGQPFGVLVDYAHNPDSFHQVMGMLRPLVAGKIIAVFGSAGERDIEKRSQQGAIAAHYCDLLILTDEDPRGEDPEAIIADIARGAEHAGKTLGQGYLTIPDRAIAIRTAFARARANDLVLLLGKGHESSIEYAKEKRPWNEAAEARKVLAEMGYGQQKFLARTDEQDAPKISIT